MHEVVERLKRERISVDDWLRRIGPAHFSHINFRGTMIFGVEKFRGRVDPAHDGTGNSDGFLTRNASASLDLGKRGQRGELTTVVNSPKISP